MTERNAGGPDVRPAFVRNGVSFREAFRAQRLAIFTLSFFLILPLSLHAGGRRRAAPASAPAEELTIVFIDTPAGVLDAGILTAGSHGAKATRAIATTTRTFGLRIGRPLKEASGRATLRAFLELSDPRCIVRLDGVVLGTQPRIIDRFAPIGITTRHRLEIEVPAQAAEGALVMNIGWDVTTD
ncbi:MAG: hypothetical protein ABI779_11725 [Acidobacteriota bacterium]